MRTGGSCAMQQGLTAEAASIVKQAVALAKRRGHAQVTPLHVANTMLGITNGLLRRACLQSHSHPLQCKALELCFNVALNRLPASTTTTTTTTMATTCCSTNPIFMGPTYHSPPSSPSISNALVAAFKRAQAHQRRGSIENQQQPLLAVKIELEQLIISILDDPSVSRVMREAGFSSTQVKSNVEQAVSLEICNSNSNNNNDSSDQNNNNNNNNNNPKGLAVSDPIRPGSEDIASVIDNLESQRRRSLVIVGECVAGLEGLVRGVMDKVEKGDVGESLRGVKFISLSLYEFGNVSRSEVEHKIEELRRIIVAKGSNNNVSNKSKGCILYVGDLKWVFDNYNDRGQLGMRGYNNYCPVDHMIMEIGKLLNMSSGVNGESNNGRVFGVMGIATFQAYMRCKNGQQSSSLETLWGLHPITIPAGTLQLSLITDSGLQNESTNKKAENRTSWLLTVGGGGDDHKQLPTCFMEVPAKTETEVLSLQSTTCNRNSSNSSLPAWLQQYKNENRGVTSNDQNCVPVGELCKKWNSMCSSIQTQAYPSEKTFTLSSASPSPSTSGFSYEQQHPSFWITEIGSKPNGPTLRMSNPNSTSSSDVIMDMEYVSKFKELNSENLKTLCNALESKVPWQKDIIPEIASTILQCRSGMLKRKGKFSRSSCEVKEETWLFFQGVDIDSKEKIAKELAGVVFGSQSNFISIALSSFSSTRADSTEDYCGNKRSRDEPSCSYIERFGDAISSNPHRVFLVEDIEQADYCSQKGFKRAIERGRVNDSNGEDVALCDAIIILSCESFSSRSRACSPSVKQNSCEVFSKEDKDDDNGASEETISPCVSLDLNISIDDDEYDEDQSVDDIGLLASVDRRIIFKIQEL